MRFDWPIQYDVIRSMGTIMQKLMTSHFAMMLQPMSLNLLSFLSKTQSAKYRSAQIYDKSNISNHRATQLKLNERAELKDAGP